MYRLPHAVPMAPLPNAATYHIRPTKMQPSSALIIVAVESPPHQVFEVMGPVFAAPRAIGIHHQAALGITQPFDAERLALDRRAVLGKHHVGVVVELRSVEICGLLMLA